MSGARQYHYVLRLLVESSGVQYRRQNTRPVGHNQQVEFDNWYIIM